MRIVKRRGQAHQQIGGVDIPAVHTDQPQMAKIFEVILHPDQAHSVKTENKENRIQRRKIKNQKEKSTGVIIPFSGKLRFHQQIKPHHAKTKPCHIVKRRRIEIGGRRKATHPAQRHGKRDRHQRRKGIAPAEQTAVINKMENQRKKDRKSQRPEPDKNIEGIITVGNQHRKKEERTGRGQNIVRQHQNDRNKTDGDRRARHFKRKSRGQKEKRKKRKKPLRGQQKTPRQQKPTGYACV